MDSAASSGVVRVGIIGMGIGRTNARGFAKAKRSQVVALCDLIEDRMQSVAADLPGPVKFYTDHREICSDPEIDAIFVGTPNQFHVPVALEAVRNGKHVMVTKPLSDSVEAARSLVEAAEAAGVVNMMSLSTRFDPRTQHIGRLAYGAQLGEIYYARARSVRRSGIPSWSPGFILKGGGAFRDMGVHVLDSAWWLMGMPKPISVSGVAGAKFGPRGVGYWDYKPQPGLGPQYAADDYAGGLIRFDNGAGLQVESFWASHQPEDLQIELFGSEAGAKVFPPVVYRTEGDAPSDSTITLPKHPEVWELMADHFNACVLDGAACAAPLRHGLIVQEMMEALLASAELGREMAL
jgi:predicted dehydrogenase